MAGYFTDRTKYVNDDWVTVKIGAVPIRQPVRRNRLESVYSWRSGLGVASKEITSQQALIASAKDASYTPLQGDTGHEFLSYKQLEVENSVKDIFLRPRNGGTQFFRGPLVVAADWYGFNQEAWPTIPAINSGLYGPKLIHLAAPTTPVSGLGEFVGQLNKLPSWLASADYLKHKVNRYRLLGNDYLNVAFGWLPFISDLQSAVNTALHANKIALQVFRDNERLIRRRRTLEPLLTTVDERDTGGLPASYRINYLDDDTFFQNGGSAFVGHLLLKETRKETYSFAGAFKYFLQGDGSVLSNGIEQLNAFQRILELRPDPYVLYELMPYSWLIDWKSSVGDVVANWTAFFEDALVMPYSYLTRKTEAIRTVTATGLGFYSGPNVISASTTWKTTQHERVRGTPYGFGLDPTTFSDQQWAILAALGLSKGPKVLR
jgi:hypothetical protein